MANPKDLTRREFVTDAGKATLGTMVAASAPLMVPQRVLGRGRHSSGDTVNIAIVGCGGMGSQNALVLAQTEHIGAVCDVDFRYSEQQVNDSVAGPDGNPRADGLKLQEQFRKAKRYTDFREMLDTGEEHRCRGDRNSRSSARSYREGGDGLWASMSMCKSR